MDDQPAGALRQCRLIWPALGSSSTTFAGHPYGTIVEAGTLPARRIVSWIDFGPIGVKRSSRSHRTLYAGDAARRQVAAVVNFPPRQIGPVMSEVLTLGFPMWTQRLC
jgi:hypothetical protein